MLIHFYDFIRLIVSEYTCFIERNDCDPSQSTGRLFGTLKSPKSQDETKNEFQTIFHLLPKQEKHYCLLRFVDRTLLCKSCVPEISVVCYFYIPPS